MVFCTMAGRRRKTSCTPRGLGRDVRICADYPAAWASSGGRTRRAMDGHQIHIDDRLDVVVGELFDLVHFMRDAESVVEVKERKAGLEGGRVGDQGEVLRSWTEPRRASPGRCSGRPSRRCGRRKWNGRGWPRYGRSRGRRSR